MQLSLMALTAMMLGAAGVDIPTGVTKLSDIGLYQIGYRYTDGRAGTMPDGWTGHFHGPTGISHTAYGQQDGKSCWLMHCPWRGGTGVTYADYDLALPKTQPIRLELAIAMKTDVAVPERSDGCDFHVSVRTAGGQERVLLDEHYASAKWKPFGFDLSDYAGSRITLRLQVGPGPKNNSSWDYAFFGDPRIVVGEGKAPAPPKPIWPVADSVKRLVNLSGPGCIPTGAKTDKVTGQYDPGTGVWTINVPWAEHRGSISYEVRMRRDGPKPAEGLIDIRAQVHGPDGPIGEPILIGRGSGVVLAKGDKRWEPGDKDVRVSVVATPDPASGPVFNAWYKTEYRVDDISATVTCLCNESSSGVGVTVTCDDPAIAEVRFGNIAAPLRRVIQVPYLGLGPVWYLPDTQLFSSIVLDWTDSKASRHDQTTAHYAAKTDGTRNPVRSSCVYTVAPRLGEVLCNIPNPPSPFMDDLAGRIMFDVWGGKYADDAAQFEDYFSYGVRDAAIIKHVWQRSGYDNALPNHVPANEALGGDEAMKHYIKTTRDLGHRTSLHENYVDFYPNSELYDPNDVSLSPDGELVKAWYNSGTRVQSFAFKPTAIMKYARMQSPEIHRRYGTNASYLDVHTCVPPWFHVDHRAGEPGAATFQAVWKAHRELFQFERETHGGPLFGEGNNHFFWAGLCDGCEAQVVGGEEAPWLVDFDLLKIHPQMVNHGMGYMERWLRSGYSSGWNSRIPSTRVMDKYRAMELAFGHAGFLANQTWRLAPYALREYHVVTPIQSRYVTAKPVRIAYDVNGKLAPTEEALRAGPLSNRVFVEYDSGLKLWCNGSEEPWSVAGTELCDYGFLARGDGLVATTTTWPTLSGGRRVGDFVDCKKWIYADARSFEPNLRAQFTDVVPGIKSFEAVGPRRFRITYTWKVHTDLSGDWRCYVHFTSPTMPSPDHIAFQNDHGLPKPVAQWKAGQTLIDGPHDVTIPDDVKDGTYAVTIGLFQPDTGRAILPTDCDERGRCIVGAIQLKGDTITCKPKPTARKTMDGDAGPFDGHTNPKREVVNFGKVATNGCVMIRPMFRSWRVTIYPREKPFTVRMNMAEFPVEGKTGPWKVHMLNSNSRDYGPVEHRTDGDWIEWETGQERVVSYCVSK